MEHNLTLSESIGLSIGTTASGVGNITTSTSTGTSGLSFYSTEIEMVKCIENVDSIDFVYKETSMVSSGWGTPTSRVFKIVFSCKDGKWNKSERIYGSIIPESQEDYEFP